MDMEELGLAIKAAKEVCDLPIFATVTFMENGQLLMGGSSGEVVKQLEKLGVDALGSNCGFGPQEMLAILKEMTENTKLPIIIKPNAGLPKMIDGKPHYNVNPMEFAQAMKEVVENGAGIIGGCCGTKPWHIKEMIRSLEG
jgi:5-methyltetrahydrofolate--homocysteine methyltransferase